MNTIGNLKLSKGIFGYKSSQLKDLFQITIPLVKILSLWLILRVFTTLVAAISSSKNPLTNFERLIPVWPPSQPLSIWLDRVLLSPWLRWDVIWYNRIVVQGYRLDDGTDQFHPLYPLLSKILFTLGVHPLLSLLLISSIASIFLIYAFYKLARMDLNFEDARTATLMMLFNPLAFILFAPYSESLFILLSVICFYLARRSRWWLSGFTGLLAALTRQQGILLLFPIAWELWETSSRNIHYVFKRWKDWLALGLIPVGLLIWLIFRTVVIGGQAPKLDSLHNFIYSTIISPGVKFVPEQAIMWPWQVMQLALVHILNSPRDPDLLTNLIFSIIFVLLAIIELRWIRVSYRLYTLIVLMISFSYYTGPVHPLMGLLRHLYLAFPVFIGLGAMLKSPRIRLSAATFGLLGFFFLLFLYSFEAWTP